MVGTGGGVEGQKNVKVKKWKGLGEGRGGVENESKKDNYSLLQLDHIFP